VSNAYVYIASLQNFSESAISDVSVKTGWFVSLQSLANLICRRTHETDENA